MRKLILLLGSTILLSACQVERPEHSFTEALRMNQANNYHCRVSNMQGHAWTRLAENENEACRQAYLACRQYQFMNAYQRPTHHTTYCRRTLVR